jgi:hypothetical protein
VNLPQQIDQMRVHLDRLVLAPIAHQVIDFLEAFLVIAPVALVGDGKVLLGVNVVERNRAGLAVRAGVLQALGAEKDEQRSDAAAISSAGWTQRQ